MNDMDGQQVYDNGCNKAPTWFRVIDTSADQSIRSLRSLMVTLDLIAINERINSDSGPSGEIDVANTLANLIV